LAAAPNRAVRASDVSREILDNARRTHGKNVRFKVASLDDLRLGEDAAELVVCCEVLEHLQDPLRALRILSALARPYCILSVPREPVWRILNMGRAAYLSRLGNTPGHVQHWSAGAFVRLVAEHFRVVAVRRPLPWTMVLGRTRSSSPRAPTFHRGS
jgi:2-polyprenyl-3-methyl-5-hydroxy-6-metoxy-1,4-benzoquinol methylase